MAKGHKLTAKQWISRASFCFGNVGHSAFYGVMSTYFIIFVTGGMFNGLAKSVADKLIGPITGLIGRSGSLNWLSTHSWGTYQDPVGKVQTLDHDW